MIDRDTFNSRMKDFFDCYQILSTRDLSDEMLYEAIKATFDNRQLEQKDNLQLFTDEFAIDASRVQQWKLFLKKIQWKNGIDFKDVMTIVIVRLKPLYDKYWIEKDNI